MRIFVNVYRALNGAMGSVYASRELADWMAGCGRLICLEIEIGEGGVARVIAAGDNDNEPDA